MQKYTKECFGSRLDITLESDKALDSVISESFLLIENFEQNYSRFIAGNILSDLNTQKQATLSPEIMQLILLAKKVSALTKGHFDITLLPILENNGYGIASEKLNNSVGYENIICEGNNITLENDVSIEFGSMGKGYALDLLYNSLKKHSDDFVINFGGDIRVAGKKTIQLEDPGNSTKSIGTVALDNNAIASSGGNKRKLSVGHHLINAQSQDSQDDKIAVYVTHKLGVMADIFATALFVTPLKISLQILEKTPGLEVLIIAADGKMYKSGGFTSSLNI